MVGSAGEGDTRHGTLPAALAFSASAGLGAVLLAGLAHASRSDAFILLPAPAQAAALAALAVLWAYAIAFVAARAPVLDAPVVRTVRGLRARFYRRFRRGRSLAEARTAFAGAAIALTALCGVVLFVASSAFGLTRWLLPLLIAAVLYLNLRLCVILCRFARFDPVWCAMLGLVYGVLVVSRFL